MLELKGHLPQTGHIVEEKIMVLTLSKVMLTTVNPKTLPFDLSDEIRFVFCMFEGKVVQVKRAV